MGQKVNPNGIRLGITHGHLASWYPQTGEKVANLLSSDLKLRNIVQKRVPDAAGLSKTMVERAGNNVKVTIFVAKPAPVLGDKGREVEKLAKELSIAIGATVRVNIEEVRKPEADPQIVADGIARQLEKRVAFRRAMKRAMESAKRAGAKGMKVCVSGRLGGAEIARTEKYHEGRVPLHTFRADVQYATSTAHTTYGVLGVKVWIYKGEVLQARGAKRASSAAEAV